MIAHLLAAAVFVTVAASPGVPTVQAAPLAQVRVLAGSVAVENCTRRDCHPVGWLNEGAVSDVRMVALVGGEYRVLVDEGWLYCHLPYGRANYEIVTGRVVIMECADYATS